MATSGSPETPEFERIRLLKLKSDDEAFRAITMLLVQDKHYRDSPIRVATRVWSAIQRQHYWLMTLGHQAVGFVLWGEISDTTLDQCVSHRREPKPDQLCLRGDAIIALGLVAGSPSLLSSLWRSFVRIHHDRPILAIRHFGARQQQAPKFIVYRNGKRCKPSTVKSEATS